ncbi:hypothetical protein K469DRAFT_696734 [Zopfia rhizophila CBS 207.26]|uniref:Uncharacterized protein n=1 Tax=Zopfia rhizophila CBS 207.26 TaxID=1314779 RepID=A0A6A6EJU6_9PEZI|nr:hypothetical protein K469DRAFT_696734 [Zopfia rhizophila CBS 207.26]
MKRWWNEYLTALRKSYKYSRNRMCAMWRQQKEDVELRNTATFPPIKKAGMEGDFATEDHDIVRELLQAFSPALPPCEQEENVLASYNELLSEPIAKHKVKTAVFRASPDKAPERNDLLAQV